MRWYLSTRSQATLSPELFCMERRIDFSWFILFFFLAWLEILAAKLPKCIWIKFFYHHGFSKQNIKFFTVNHFYAITAEPRATNAEFRTSLGTSILIYSNIEISQKLWVFLRILCHQTNNSLKLRLTFEFFLKSEICTQIWDFSQTCVPQPIFRT